MIYRCCECRKRIQESDGGRCTQCRRGYRRECDKNRNRKRHGSQYGRQWKKTRATIIAMYPLCLHCYIKGEINAAVEVDHILRIGDESLICDVHSLDNLAPLCKSCHTWKTHNIDNKSQTSPEFRRWLGLMNKAKDKYDDETN